MTTTTITYSCTADFGPCSGVDQDLTKSEIAQSIQMDYDVENTILLENDQGIDSDDIAEIVFIKVQIDCMADRSDIAYTVTADVELEEYEDEDDWC
jgi:hypothetical protein